MFRPLASGIAFAALAFFAGCAASEAATFAAPSPESGATQLDIFHDRGKFLMATSLLGQSLEEDIDLLRKMTGYTFNPQPLEGVFADGEKRFSEFVPFTNDRRLISATFWYRLYGGGHYHSSVFLVLKQQVFCITAEDLQSVIGAPFRVITAKEMPAKGSGPSSIWTVVYHYANGAQTLFQFSTGLCINDIQHSSIQEVLRTK